MSSKKYRVRTDDRVLGHFSGTCESEAILKAIMQTDEITSVSDWDTYYVKRAGSAELEVEWSFVQVRIHVLAKAINEISYSMKSCTSLLSEFNKLLTTTTELFKVAK